MIAARGALHGAAEGDQSDAGVATIADTRLVVGTQIVDTGTGGYGCSEVVEVLGPHSVVVRLEDGRLVKLGEKRATSCEPPCTQQQQYEKDMHFIDNEWELPRNGRDDKP